MKQAIGRRILASLVAAATLGSVAAVGAVTAVAQENQPVKGSSVVINEVFAGNTKESGDALETRDDWVELKNTGKNPVDVKGWGIYDEKQKKHFTIGVDKEINTDTVIPAGGYLVAYIDYATADPGLGSDADSVYLTSAAGDKYDASAEVDSTSWDAKALGGGEMTTKQSWSRADDGSFKLSNHPTPGVANDFTTNDFATTGESGAATKPGQSDAKPMEVGDWPGLDTVTAIDAAGEFGASGQEGDHTDGNLSGLVYDTANNVLWAADNDLNPTLGNTEDKGPGSINKFVKNEQGAWVQDPSDGWTFTSSDGVVKGGKQLHFKDGKGGVDSEGITVINGDASQGVFIGAERDNEHKKTPRPSILRYNVASRSADINGDGAEDLTATNEWDLTDALKEAGVTLEKGGDANLGVEGLAYVPNKVLESKGFKDKSGNVYDSAKYSNSYDGLFIAALEKTGHLYALALSTKGNVDTVQLVKDIAIPEAAVKSGYTLSVDVLYDAESGKLETICDNSCGASEPSGTAKVATWDVDKATGEFTIENIVKAPGETVSENTEGYAVSPNSACQTNVSGASDASKAYKPVFFADDGVTNGHSLRQGWLACDGGATPPTEDSTDVTLFGITDFHGHIENGAYLATALKQTEAKNPNTLFVGAGDLVGASAYASSIQKDVPATDQLKAMGLEVSAVGNHEFDQGADDLVNRIVPQIAPGQYVVANVTGGALEGKIQPYVIEEVGGKKVAFIGGVFESLLSSVSPAGMKGITVTDPVKAINQYADQLSDGSEANGEADAVVALVHGDADDLKGLDANVDAAFAGHTHLKKQTTTDAGAPVLQAASYGEAFATVDLKIEGSGAQAKVTAVDPKVNDVFAADGTTPLYEADAAVKKIDDDAQAKAKEIGKKQVGTIDADSTFNRGSDKVGDLTGRGNNRGVESTLGDMEGGAALWAANYSLGDGAADIGVINAGGLRADLDANNDKVITYQEAHDVLPFGNTNAVVTLTGKQLKTLFEQQWQPAGAQRPVLWLGVSSNVSYQYTTDEETVDGVVVPRGHVFNLAVNGKQVADDATYKVAGNSFLLSGGDNFTVFQQGTGYVDTGFVDLDGFVEYLKANPGLKANRSRLSAGFANVKLNGDVLSFDVNGLSYTTDETKPIALDLHVNGVDFGVTEGVNASNYGEATNQPGAGWVTVSKTMSADEKAKLIGADGKVMWNTAEVKPLYTEAEVQAAKDARQHTDNAGNAGNAGSAGNAGNAGNAGSTADAKTADLAATGADVVLIAAVLASLAIAGFVAMVRRHLG